MAGFGPGNWFNLPEFGITERLGGNKASVYQTQTKANPGGMTPQPPQMSFAPSSGPTVLGSSIAPPAENMGGSPASGGGGFAPSGTNQASDSNDVNNAFLNAINDAFKGTQKYLDQAESNLRGQLPGIEKDINSLIGQSRSQLDLQRQAGEQQLQQQQVSGEQRKEDALSAARRLYNELLMGGQQRFGGASSAGEAFRTLGANELQRNNAQTQREFQNFMSQIEGARTNLQNQYTTASQSLEAQRVRMVNEARRDFQNKLLEIDRARGEAEDRKANMRLEALQQLRNQVYQIEFARAQEQQNLDAMLNQANQQLQAYIQQGQQGLQGLNANTDVDPVTGLPIEQGGTTNEIAMMGIRDEEDPLLRGSILRPRQEEFSLAA